MLDALTILGGIWSLVVYAIGLWLGVMRGKGSQKLTIDEFESLKRAYREVERTLEQATDKEEIKRLALLMRSLEDLAKRQKRLLEPKSPPLPTT